MSARGEIIGQWTALALFFVLLAFGVWSRPTAAQTALPPQPTQVTCCAATPSPLWGWWPGIATLLAATLGASVAAWVAHGVANKYTARVKRVEATLQFSKQFHELIQLQRALNGKYEEVLAKCNKALATKSEAEKTEAERTEAGIQSDVIEKIAKGDAKAWWWQFFDLLLYEFDFWQQGYVREERFIEWMVWRWHDSHPRTDVNEPRWETCGMDYIEGWDRWRSHPAHGGRLLELLDRIHKAKHPNKVPDIVDEYRGITAAGDYQGPVSLSADIKRDRIKLKNGDYTELATGRKFSVNDNQISN